MQELTTRNLTRRIIRNDSDAPVSFGLRRVLRKVHVKVQSMGPQLIWQLYLREPGAGLARSRFVHFRETGNITVPDIPPGLRPRPQGGTDTGSTQVALRQRTPGTFDFFIPLVVRVGKDRRITALSVDSISDLEGGGKDDHAPSPRNAEQFGQAFDEATNTFSVNIPVVAGDSVGVSVNYTYIWEPSPAVLEEWENERKAAVARITEELLTQKFERDKALITEKSKIRSRPANDLRREERFEIMNRMVSYFSARGQESTDPTPLEIEYFHRYFNIDSIFVYTHPSWWKPRYTPASTSFERPPYEITSESEPAPMGSSLGWLMQFDGDTRRNEFLNSPWARVCVPISPGREREAIMWLAQHVEGQIGFDPDQEPLKSLLRDIEVRRERESQLGIQGPDNVIEVTPPILAGQLQPQEVFPVVNEFDVTVPTEGFVYDELKVLSSEKKFVITPSKPPK